MTSSDLERELHEWHRTSSALRQHGLPSLEIDIARGHDMGLMFNVEMSKRMRCNFHSFLEEVDRRQAVVQELIQSSNQLRDELSAQTRVSEKFEVRTNDLRSMLDHSKTRVENLESKLTNSSTSRDIDTDRLRNTNSEIKIRYKQLLNTCRSKDEEIKRLKAEVKQLSDDDKERLQKQSQVFQALRKKGRRYIDDSVADIVDSYERQIQELHKELNSHRGDRSDTTTFTQGTSSTPQFKHLIQTYEKEIKDAKKRHKVLENDINLLQLEVQSRPELKELRHCQTRMKKLELIIKKHNLMEADERYESQSKKGFSTLADEIDFLPLSHCRKYLKKFCNELRVSDLEQVTSKLEKTTLAAESYPRLEKFASQVSRLVDSDDVSTSHVKPVESLADHEVVCERSLQYVVRTLKHSHKQLQSLPELQASVCNLNDVLLPWNRLSTDSQPPTVTNIIDTVNEISEQVRHDDNAKQSKSVDITTSSSILQAIVDHFMKLFNVTMMTGCYARMNDIYTKLGETHNIMMTLRDLLDIPTESKNAAVVDSVAQMCRMHSEFFPIFHDIAKQLMSLLSVSRIDHIVPAVRDLIAGHTRKYSTITTTVSRTSQPGGNKTSSVNSVTSVV